MHFVVVEDSCCMDLDLLFVGTGTCYGMAFCFLSVCNLFLVVHCDMLHYYTCGYCLLLEGGDIVCFPDFVQTVCAGDLCLNMLDVRVGVLHQYCNSVVPLSSPFPCYFLSSFQPTSSLPRILVPHQPLGCPWVLK